MRREQFCPPRNFSAISQISTLGLTRSASGYKASFIAGSLKPGYSASSTIPIVKSSQVSSHACRKMPQTGPFSPPKPTTPLCLILIGYRPSSSISTGSPMTWFSSVHAAKRSALRTPHPPRTTALAICTRGGQSTLLTTTSPVFAQNMQSKSVSPLGSQNGREGSRRMSPLTDGTSTFKANASTGTLR